VSEASTGNSESPFRKPGQQGALPPEFVPWKWSVSYTVRPELRSELSCGHEYLICSTILRRRPNSECFTGFADLYERAHRIASVRATHLKCEKKCHDLHTRTVMHTWFRHEGTNLLRAVVILGVRCLRDGEVGSTGESQPSAESLAVPGGMTKEELATRKGDTKGLDEIYSDYDVREEPGPVGILTLSYGEYVKSTEALDYTPFIERAESLASFHLRLAEARPDERSTNPDIVRREWFCATNPDIAVVHIYLWM
jgi:hypothetical protein